ncbi:toll/interleukin-1 receptor domain-containing protein [Amycolatopsis nigrescens]|uniref:toll/interleukin-1 receptor domain-containing protein n=1 Tax=Amycolatopsis nigrescens TaxID=381445 RepID=UPI000370F050|nr:toll/interleukin-1 receptor domain-containing protein [Amycolatopsis nigrescens]
MTLDGAAAEEDGESSAGAPRVFVSYAHESEEHKNQVLGFCRLLRRHGVDARLDQYDSGRRWDWYAWMTDQITRADFVIVIASPQYRVAGDGSPGRMSKGVQTEAALLRDLLHSNRATWLRRLLPVVLPGRSVDDIPLFLQPSCADHYQLSALNSASIAELLQVLTERPTHRAPALGQVPPLETAKDMSPVIPPAFMMPRDHAAFTGREAELENLLGLVPGISTPEQWSDTVCVIDGMPGVGKTTFAVHAAYRLADRFPGGQLFLELHGHTPTRQPVEPAEALESLLLALGVAPQQVPASLEDRARMWRDQLAGRRILLLLDGASSYDQVRPLLAGAAGCFTMVTSRRRMVSADDVHPISLDVLSPEQAGDMLRRLVRTPAVADDPDGVDELTKLCGHLPLAIALSAGRLRSHPCWSVRYLVDQLCTARQRIAEFRSKGIAVAAAFDMSYRDLPDDTRRLFRRLSLHPGHDFDAYAAAALDDSEHGGTQHRLEALYLDHLIDEPTPGRYRFHDLIREYSASLVARDTEAGRDDAMNRLFGYYLHTTIAANDWNPSNRTSTYPAAATRPRHTPALDSQKAALDWLRVERENLVSCVDHATASATSASHAIQLATALNLFLQMDGQWQHSLATSTAALAAARAAGDTHGEAALINDLGCAQFMAQDYPAAAANLRQARALFAGLGNTVGEASALNTLGAVQVSGGDLAAATESFRRSQHLFKGAGHALGEARTKHNLGIILHSRGEYPAAILSLNKALDIYMDSENPLGAASCLAHIGRTQLAVGNRTDAALNVDHAYRIFKGLDNLRGEAKALAVCGMVHHATGDAAAAQRSLARARELYASLGDRPGEATALTALGAVQHARGRCEESVVHLRRASKLCHRLGDRVGETEALNELGRLAADWPKAGDSMAYHKRALELSRSTGLPLEEARALEGIGNHLLHETNLRDGIGCLRQALRIYEKLDVPEEQVLLSKLARITASSTKQRSFDGRVSGAAGRVPGRSPGPSPRPAEPGAAR